MQEDQSNHYFQMALRFVNNTGRHIFLTGKAGTGKTTFLRKIKETSHKKLAIVAPTGVAAVNAGGTTIHSFFQLPFGAFLPGNENVSQHSGPAINNHLTMLQQMRLSGDKRKLMSELELLIIDEVSMVRPDLLDAIDAVLRHFRKHPNVPFGGVQMLFIGDLFQLPPVVKDDEWKIISRYYASPFFFDALSLKESSPLYLELKKIYRQSDASFIGILNNVRNNNMQQADFTALHKYYKPGFQPAVKGEYITLTTHNSKADTINQSELKKLPGKIYSFEAGIEGEFNERSFPVERSLKLKEGAQIMFIKNDKGENRRFYNGKIGTVKKIGGDEISVIFPGSEEEMLLEKDTWKNIRYQYTQGTDKIEEETLGTFTQFPVRLAWAITIHKSQGLTFSKAIIDAGESFAPGQVYVALSRLTSLEGLILYSQLQPNCISSDERIVAYTSSEPAYDVLQQQLAEAQKGYLYAQLYTIFDWSKLFSAMEEFVASFAERQIPLQGKAKALAVSLLSKISVQQEIAGKFTKQLDQLLPEAGKDGYAIVHQRVEAACNYFSKNLNEEFFTPLKAHQDDMSKRTKVKKYLKEVHSIMLDLLHKKDQLEQAMKLSSGLVKGADADTLLKEMKEDIPSSRMAGIEIAAKMKATKGETHLISLQMFREGKCIQQIAEERGMVRGTIETHLLKFLATGEIELSALVTEEKISEIRKVISELGDTGSAVLKEKLGPDYSYNEIRAVMNDHRKKSEERTFSK
ncbi:MAG TPA: helix-turn-helix domain-containing protein [Cytophagaceae bacterium]|jgi:hypothetical protein|nr:helix-turn-helix domain-containing protein [Cytophagaceae bacterium]